MKNFEELPNVVDTGTTYITVETPEGWKCPRKNCTSDFLHSHNTYADIPTKRK